MEELIEFEPPTVSGSFGNEFVVLGEEIMGKPSEHLRYGQLILMVPVK